MEMLAERSEPGEVQPQASGANMVMLAERSEAGEVQPQASQANMEIRT